MPHLFSYGTLQQDDVQRSTFGRLLAGHADVLPGYLQDGVAIDDPDVVATSGKTHHPIVKHSGGAGDRVAGTVFEISDAELAQADATPSPVYRCVAVTSGVGVCAAWVHVERPLRARRSEGLLRLPRRAVTRSARFGEA